ncbi:DNRLRE domain-containing protein [Streptomyces sp. CBMA29]|uniref:DNRLRE domain-containing protein n=1 Tax=Streptomyces sp. CBMA29 TaxID=1896314 RepID=UPI0016619E56|nr:DNRLRE domain-containing protein [Streptomyces sp. CBMA29]MBD0736451.1 sugar-binding protein [Streptomyces sp. CBMA29]
MAVAPTATANTDGTQDVSASEAADLPSARVAARLEGKRVEALSERTETSTTWVNKDGSLTTETSAGPIRFKDAGTGAWRAVDAALTLAADGSVVTKAHPRGLRLSGGSGSRPVSLKAAQQASATDLVTLGAGQDRITLQWHGGLPAPQLNGTRATYRNAVPGADVVVEATRTGFEQFVDITAKPAAGFTYTLPLRADGLKVRQQADGSVVFTDKSSRQRATMPAPVMWDATVDGVSGEHTHRARVSLRAVAIPGGVDLVITPDAAFLADPATRYPVTVDPSTSALGNLFDTYVQQGETVDWSADTELDLGNPGTTNSDGSARTARSFITWNTAPFADALVTSAKLSLWNFHSGNTDCKAYPWEVWASGKASTSSRWTAQPVWNQKEATSTETRGNPACTSAPDGWVNADVTTLAQTWASAKNATSGMGLRATSESTTGQWKRFNSANATTNPPKLVVTYNYRPRNGTKQEAGPPYFSYDGAYTVNTLTPVLRDTFVDPNGDKVDGTFQVFDAATGLQVGNSLVSPFVPSGQVASVTVPAGLLADGKTYTFRTSPYDGTHYNLGWSASRTFTVDTKAPSAPTKIVSTDYPSTAWVKGAGQAGVFTVTPPAADHNWLEWSLDGVTWTKVATAGAAGDKALGITPAQDGTQTLQVRTVDKADNRSEAATYTFHAGPGGFSQPSDGDRTARRLTLAAEADAGKFDKVTFSWRRSDADAWTPVPLAHVSAGGISPTAWPVALTNGRNTPLTWDAASTVSPDGAVQIRAEFSGPANASATSNPLNAVVDRNADTAATQEVGPGSVNLLTGDYTLTSPDVAYYGMSVTRTASSRTPTEGADQKGQAAIFGSAWVSGITAELTESDYAYVRRLSDTAVTLVKADGTKVNFTSNAAKTGWIPEPGSADLVLKGSVSAAFTLNDGEGVVTEFGKTAAGVDTWQMTSSRLDGLDTTTTTTKSETVVVGTDTVARPVRVVAPTSGTDNATCLATPTTKGCRVLEFVYATSTTATAQTFGDYAGQVKDILLYATGKGGASATSRSVATYRYDTSGRLRQEWNPRLDQATQTTYGYDTAGRITSYRSTTDQPWTFTYGQAGDTAVAGPGMLLGASRPTLSQGSAATVDGTGVTTVVYGVPLTGTAAPYKMGASDVKAWGQTDSPTDATAVFPSDSVPASSSGSALPSTAYKRASLSYLDASGRTVNEVTPGGHVSTTESDRFGNTVRELTAGNRSVALGLTAADKATQADLGIAQLSSAERALQLSTTTVWDVGGLRELQEFGPLRRLDLTADLKSGTTRLASAGTSVTGRSWTVKEYDTGRPTDGSATVRDQVTRTLAGIQVREHPTVQGDVRTTQTVLDWTRGVPLKKIQDPGGLALTTAYQYDAKGQLIKETPPGATGTDAATTLTAYWSATGTGTCAGRPEWADLLCSSGPAGAITGGGANPTQLAGSTYEYDSWGNTTSITNTANGVTRTTATTYDSAGRAAAVTVTGGLGQAVPTATTTYDAATGRVASVTSPSGGTITKTFDTLGRLTGYQDADSGTTTTEYDHLDRPVKVTDSVPSTQTFTYDHTTEPRGLVTTIIDSAAGTFSGTYDADATVVSEKLPGGYTLAVRTDTTDTPVERTYTRDSDGALVYSDTITESVHDQATTNAGRSEQEFTYDAAGRLTVVRDTADTVCTRRGYGFDARTNRTSVSTAQAAPGQDCPASGTAVTSTYDSADRLVGAGYTYDAFGRTTTLPGSVSVGYFANDIARQETTATQRQTWNLDSGMRFRNWTAEQKSGSAWVALGTKTNHYDCDADSPRWIVEDAATGAVTRNVSSLSGGLTATTGASGDAVLQLSTVHGDIAVQLPLDSSVAPTVLDTDEYGNERAGQNTARYGWLGVRQRSAETVTGHILMGIRLYDPSTGRFLSVDPVFGGGENRYGYPGDPINQNDLDGRKWKCKAKCQLAGRGSHCTGYIYGAGSGHSEEDAAREAKRDTVHQAPRGCYARHCKAFDCTKNRVRQFFDSNYSPRSIHRHNAPNWMRSANHNSWGFLFHSEVWRGTYGSFCGCSP